MLKVNVSWDTDGEIIDDLPNVVEIPDCVKPQEIADWLSDEYGWCVTEWWFD